MVFIHLNVCNLMLTETTRATLYPLYRPEPNNEIMGKFLDEFSTLLEEISVVTQDIVILDDFNIHIDVNIKI